MVTHLLVPKQAMKGVIMVSGKIKKGNRVRYIGRTGGIPPGRKGTVVRDESDAGYVLVAFDDIDTHKHVKASNLELV